MMLPLDKNQIIGTKPIQLSRPKSIKRVNSRFEDHEKEIQNRTLIHEKIENSRPQSKLKENIGNVLIPFPRKLKLGIIISFISRL